MPRTKREILSTIARLFDPMGWVAPVIIAAKIIMQQLWRCKCDWDETIPPLVHARWTAVYQALSGIDGMTLPRWTHRDSDTVHYELHGFADASSVAYAAAVYMRVQSQSGEVAVTLLAAKSKVAPVKPTTIPRLELAAAVLLARLLEFVRVSLEIPTSACHCWTDSTVTLAWLGQHPSRWKTFVAHRVSFVQSRFPSILWHHVPTADNPADCASRGLLGSELASHHLWWHGPPWLRLDKLEWPAGPSEDRLGSPPHEVGEEARTTVAGVAVTVKPWDFASTFSKWPRLIRVSAYILRFVDRCRRRGEINVSDGSPSRGLTAGECHRARLFWLKALQADFFPRELTSLRKGDPLNTKSPILSLNPFLDNDGVIRVGGRLRNAPIPMRSRHPILLKSHPLTTLIVKHAHCRALHAGVQLTLSTVRREYWILRARTLVKSVIHGCLPCVRERAAVPAQLMGQLPRSRVTAPARPFLHCGVDYAGPIAVRSSGGRGIKSHKCYVALFVCLATRAIHLELVGGYATPAFLDAYTRFCARRGLPETMYSDNGTTFTGADQELKRAYRDALRDPEFQNHTASDRVTWKFMPPHSPHFGGLWEAGVRSLKHHLRRVLGSHTLTFEELTTLLCKIESCLNSRPLGPLSDSLDEYDALTPGHFLVGSALNVYPEPSVLHLNENRMSRWQQVRHLAERFWKHWQSDYVNTLQQRSKWREAQPSVRVGTMVLLRDPNLPPSKWALGRVVTCHPGPDGLVRVVSVRTAKSEYKRPLAKLCLLPIDIESQLNQHVKTDASTL